MGIVYEARHRVTGRTCALKVLDDLRGKPDLIERFRREVTLATSIGHPGIAEVLDADVDAASGSFYIAMELLRGSTLRTYLESPDASRLRLLGLVRKLLEPLAAAHSHGVVHRDLKPDNVFVLDGEPDRVKLLDFGIARNHEAPEITAAGIALGTPHYMSPEQAMDVRKCEASSDVWSVGVMLYEALSGTRPFRGDSSHAVAVAICTHDHEPLSSVVPDIDSRLSMLVDRCLDKEPSRRPKDAGALLLELQRILATSSIAPPRSEAPRALRKSSEPAPRLDPRMRGVIFACACIGLSLGGAFYAAYRTGAETWLASTLLLAAIVFTALFAVLSGFYLFDRRGQRAPVVETEREQRVPVKTAPDVRPPAAVGPDDARVTIVYFVDYASPKSRLGRQVLERIREKYPDEVRVVWRHCPSTPLSARIAEAVVEAVHQGGPLVFFRVSEVLLRTTRRLSESHLEFVFTQLRLSVRSLRHSLQSRRHWLVVEDDRELACTLGIDVGPAYVIDGRVFDGDTPEPIVFDAVEGLLARSGQGASPAVTDGTRIDDGGAVRVEQILVQWTAVASSRLRVVRSRAEAKDRAERLHRRAKMREADFQTLSRTFSDAELNESVLELKSLPTTLSRFAASLRRGEMSDVLESERGFHILRRVR
jgi:protein-disulfide isomerase